MWLGKAFQGTVSSQFYFRKEKRKKVTFFSTVSQFPSDLLETADSPNIYITSPSISTSRFQPPPLSMGMNIMHSLNSPNSSPTTSDFQGGGGHYHQHHGHHPQQQHHHAQHSRQHGGGNGYSRTGDSSSSTPLPSSPGSISMDLFDDGSCDLPASGRPSTKRQRLDDGVGVNGINGGIGGLVGGGGGGGSGGGGGGGSGGGSGGGNSSDAMSLLSSVSSPGAGTGLATLTVPKKSSRARSDSAPLGYGGVGTTAMHSWQQQQGEMSGGGSGGRPRSGSGMVPHRDMGGHAR